MIDVQEDASTFTIKITESSLESANAGKLKAELKALTIGKDKSVRLDVSQVEFIDSSGIGALLSLYKEVQQSGSTMVIAGATPGFMSVIELLRLHQILSFES